MLLPTTGPNVQVPFCYERAITKERTFRQLSLLYKAFRLLRASRPDVVLENGFRNTGFGDWPTAAFRQAMRRSTFEAVSLLSLNLRTTEARNAWYG